MEVNLYILLIILGSAIVTFVPRVLPLVILSRLKIPDWGMRWLNYVPISVMAALVGQELILPNGKPSSFQDNIELVAALPTFAAAILSRSLIWTVVAGIISMMLLRLLF
jgi:branched-subunit amino acid transport protein